MTKPLTPRKRIGMMRDRDATSSTNLPTTSNINITMHDCDKRYQKHSTEQEVSKISGGHQIVRTFDFCHWSGLNFHALGPCCGFSAGCTA